MSNDVTPSTSWKSLKAVSRLLMACSAFILLAALILVGSEAEGIPGFATYKFAILAGLAIAAIILKMRGKRQYDFFILEAQKPQYELIQKLEWYKKAVLRYMMSTQLAVTLGAIVFLYTRDFTYLAFAAVICGFMVGILPRNKTIQGLLHLSADDFNKLDTKK